MARATRQEGRLALFDFIEAFYNMHRQVLSTRLPLSRRVRAAMVALARNRPRRRVGGDSRRSRGLESLRIDFSKAARIQIARRVDDADGCGGQEEKNKDYMEAGGRNRDPSVSHSTKTGATSKCQRRGHDQGFGVGISNALPGLQS
jgi:hypothetical protein